MLVFIVSVVPSASDQFPTVWTKLLTHNWLEYKLHVLSSTKCS